jgi:hypothetical protein
MKNCSTTNFTNKMETYLDFNKKYKILKSPTYFINWERDRLLVLLIKRYIYI